MNTHRYQTQIVKIIGEEHRTADDIFVKIRKKFDRIGIATVYRNLDNLVDNGELMKLTGVFDKTYYERNKGPHAHLIDPKTLTIVDVKIDPKFFDFPVGFVLKETQMNFVGSWEGTIPLGEISLLPGSQVGVKEEQNDENTQKIPENSDSVSLNEDVLDEKDSEKKDLDGKSNDSGSGGKDENTHHHKIFREF